MLLNKTIFASSQDRLDNHHFSNIAAMQNVHDDVFCAVGCVGPDLSLMP